MFYKLLQFFISPIVNFFWVGDINNLKNVPNKGSVIICANHNSYLDFFILGSILKRRIYFLAGEVFFKSRLWKPLVLLTGQIKVDRTSKDKSLVYGGVKNILSNNNLLGIFPEGTRSRDGKISNGYNGAVKFAYKYGVPIIPVGITGAFNAWPPHKKMPKLVKCNINIGDGFIVRSDDFNVETKKLMEKISFLITDSYGQE